MRHLHFFKNFDMVNEGRYDGLVNNISSNIFGKWKQDYDNGEVSSTYKNTFDTKDIYVDIEAFIKFEDEYEFMLSADGFAETDYDYIMLNFIIDKNDIDWVELSMTIKDAIRHEIEHLTHSDGFNLKPSKHKESDNDIRDMIINGFIPKSSYFKLPKEVDAMIQGLYFRAKKERKPVLDVMNKYLTRLGFTDTEKSDIIDIWRKRAKQLAITI